MTDSRGDEGTDVSNSVRRLDSCPSVTSLSPSSKPSLSHRAKAFSIFLFVIGDFCWASGGNFGKYVGSYLVKLQERVKGRLA